MYKLSVLTKYIPQSFPLYHLLFTISKSSTLLLVKLKGIVVLYKFVEEIHVELETCNFSIPHVYQVYQKFTKHCLSIYNI